MATENRREQLRDSAAGHGAKGKLEEAGGKLRGTYGDLADDPSPEFKGKVQELKGKLRQELGWVGEKISEAGESDDEPEDATA
jgi:uncharacterized protein YjbJ (UPF0337 family)